MSLRDNFPRRGRRRPLSAAPQWRTPGISTDAPPEVPDIQPETLARCRADVDALIGDEHAKIAASIPDEAFVSLIVQGEQIAEAMLGPKDVWPEQSCKHYSTAEATICDACLTRLGRHSIASVAATAGLTQAACRILALSGIPSGPASVKAYRIILG